MICRLCLTNSECYLDFFNENSLLLNLAGIVSKYFWFEPQKNDPISNIICEKCWFSVESFHKFYISIEEAQNNLHTVQVNFNEDNKETILNIEENFQDFNEFDVDNIKTDVDDNSPKNKTYEDDNRESSQIIDPLENNLKQINSDVDNEEKPKNKLKPARKKCIQSKKSIKSDECKLVKTPKLYTSVEVEHDAMISSFMKLICDECKEEFPKYMLLKRHVRTKHNGSGYAKCCDKKFYKRILLIEHINIHLNPNYFRCNECYKSFGSRRSFESHKLTRHPTNETKIYKCDLCSRQYIRKYLLEQHYKLSHTAIEKKWKCDICDKAFITKNRMITHRTYMHTNAYSKICYICAKVCRSKTIFDKHMLEHEGTVQPKLQCEQCQAWLKNSASLKKHMIRHKEENIQHSCNICGKAAASKFALKNHLRYVHTEALHKCTVCEKSFKKPITLKEHMSTHTGEVLYTCPLCPKTFNSNANMWSHKKKVHRTQWDIDRKNRKAPQEIDL